MSRFRQHETVEGLVLSKHRIIWVSKSEIIDIKLRSSQQQTSLQPSRHHHRIHARLLNYSFNAIPKHYFLLLSARSGVVFVLPTVHCLGPLQLWLAKLVEWSLDTWHFTFWYKIYLIRMLFLSSALLEYLVYFLDTKMRYVDNRFLISKLFNRIKNWRENQ